MPPTPQVTPGQTWAIGELEYTVTRLGPGSCYATVQALAGECGVMMLDSSGRPMVGSPWTLVAGAPTTPTPKTPPSPKPGAGIGIGEAPVGLRPLVRDTEHLAELLREGCGSYLESKALDVAERWLLAHARRGLAVSVDPTLLAEANAMADEYDALAELADDDHRERRTAAMLRGFVAALEAR